MNSYTEAYSPSAQLWCIQEHHLVYMAPIEQAFSFTEATKILKWLNRHVKVKDKKLFIRSIKIKKTNNSGWLKKQKYDKHANGICVRTLKSGRVRYCPFVRINHKSKELGSYDTREEATKVRNDHIMAQNAPKINSNGLLEV